jgi:hypothetical protein
VMLRSITECRFLPYAFSLYGCLILRP